MRRAMKILLGTALLPLALMHLPAQAEDNLEEPPIIVNIEPVIIEGEPIKDKLTPEEIRQKFQDALGSPNREILKEKWVSSDTMLIETRGAKYCVKFVPPHMRSAIEPVAGFAGLCLGQ